MLEAVIACASGERDDTSFCRHGHRESVEAVDRAVAQARRSRAEVFTDNEQFNDGLNRSAADLQMLTTETRYGLYPYADVPWFSTRSAPTPSAVPTLPICSTLAPSAASVPRGLLPDYINWLKVRGLRHAGAESALHVHRYGDEIAVNVERRSGDIALIITV
jgi:hypothetical protein